MHKKSTILLLIFCLIIGFSTIAIAQDTIISATIESIKIKTDKNGDSYTMMIIQESRTLNGIAYTASAPVMAFGKSAVTARQYKPGDTFKAVVNEGKWKGNTSYRIHSFIK